MHVYTVGICTMIQQAGSQTFIWVGSACLIIKVDLFGETVYLLLCMYMYGHSSVFVLRAVDTSVFVVMM